MIKLSIFSLAIFVLLLAQIASGFSVHRSIVTRSTASTFVQSGNSARRTGIKQPHTFASNIARQTTTRCGRTSLSMYNLPPGRNNKDDLGDILKGAASLILVVAFFASPLGGFVLGIFNSFFILALLLPVVGTIGVSVWQYFNTISGACPNCGAPVRVLKSSGDGIAQPSICISCGSILQANYDNSGIDNITGRNSIDGMSGSPFGGGSIFDMFGGPSVTRTTTTIYEEKTAPKKDKIRRESTIIDVEVDEDNPWQ